jgi:hypothetical protein
LCKSLVGPHFKNHKAVWAVYEITDVKKLKSYRTELQHQLFLSNILEVQIRLRLHMTEIFNPVLSFNDIYSSVTNIFSSMDYTAGIRLKMYTWHVDYIRTKYIFYLQGGFCWE